MLQVLPNFCECDGIVRSTYISIAEGNGDCCAPNAEQVSVSDQDLPPSRSVSRTMELESLPLRYFWYSYSSSKQT